jgi:hypothetical protein
LGKYKIVIILKYFEIYLFLNNIYSVRLKVAIRKKLKNTEKEESIVQSNCLY